MHHLMNISKQGQWASAHGKRQKIHRPKREKFPSATTAAACCVDKKATVVAATAAQRTNGHKSKMGASHNNIVSESDGTAVEQHQAALGFNAQTWHTIANLLFLEPKNTCIMHAHLQTHTHSLTHPSIHPYIPNEIRSAREHLTPFRNPDKIRRTINYVCGMQKENIQTQERAFGESVRPVLAGVAPSHLQTITQIKIQPKKMGFNMQSSHDECEAFSKRSQPWLKSTLSKWRNSK